MISKKYTSDYRLENVTDKDGKIKTVPVYCGTYYQLASERDKLKQVRLYSLIACGFYWVFFFFGLAFDSGSLRQIYVSLPYVFSCLPAAFYSFSVYNFSKSVTNPPEKGFTRKQRDAISEKIPQNAFISFLLSCGGMLGMVFYFIFRYKTYGGVQDVLILVSLSVMATASLFVFSLKRHFKMQP